MLLRLLAVHHYASTLHSFPPGGNTHASRLEHHVRANSKSNAARFTRSLFASLSLGLICLSNAQFAFSGDSRTDDREDLLVPQAIEKFLGEYCLSCHDGDSPEAGFHLGFVLGDQKSIDASGGFISGQGRMVETLERALRRIERRQMPPVDSDRPDDSEHALAVNEFAKFLDQHRQPLPKSNSLRRLTRTEYGNAIRDLLDLKCDPTEFFPADEISHGFDNVTVSNLSPLLVDRYIHAAEKLSHRALGILQNTVNSFTYRVKPDVTQESQMPRLPLGTRGGCVFEYHFPRDGDYQFEIRLARDRNEHVEGLHRQHTLELLLDRAVSAEFTVKPPDGQNGNSNYFDAPSHAGVDRHLVKRIALKAGARRVGVTFRNPMNSLDESLRQPLNVRFNSYRHPRLSPAVYEVTIIGPFESTTPGNSQSRRRVLGQDREYCEDDGLAAQKIFLRLARHAFRRPVVAEDISQSMRLYRQTTATEGFDQGIAAGLSAILVDPNFLFRIERNELASSEVTRGLGKPISDLELASRLSFFLWSSIPDDRLLSLAEEERLHEPEVLRSEVSRMLADAKAEALVTNFFSQWLHLRNLASVTPDMRRYPDFDDNLRQAFRKETEYFIREMIESDSSVLSLIKADHTYLNERLAKHYGIPHVFGPHFRRVSLDDSTGRGGLLRHGSVLAVTSYATRTSPVIRGKWILENLLGTTPPPPPPDIPTLEDNSVSAGLSVRDRLNEHRANPTCATCHDLIDPVGFSLEAYDAIGGKRSYDEDQPIDASGGLPDGQVFSGVEGLEHGIHSNSKIFVATMVEKLLTYAMGRGIEPIDGPAIRSIVAKCEESDYRFSSLIQEIVNSPIFRMRSAE